MTAIEAEPAATVCPICRQPVCSLRDIRDRLATACARAGNFAVRVAQRLCLYLALFLLVGVGAGWWSP